MGNIKKRERVCEKMMVKSIKMVHQPKDGVKWNSKTHQGDDLLKSRASWGTQHAQWNNKRKR